MCALDGKGAFGNGSAPGGDLTFPLISPRSVPTGTPKVRVGFDQRRFACQAGTRPSLRLAHSRARGLAPRNVTDRQESLSALEVGLRQEFPEFPLPHDVH